MSENLSVEELDPLLRGFDSSTERIPILSCDVWKNIMKQDKEQIMSDL